MNDESEKNFKWEVKFKPTQDTTYVIFISKVWDPLYWERLT